ncbi:MAG: hypothetical protein HQ581_12425 [Planctomycetes bacterium]|nr:hypothetical protein [Planctomycetota bacterium]
MNSNADIRQDDQHVLDLLVDDELDAERRRELLGRLDRDPDGWRRCALAFLEAQSWRRTIPTLSGGEIGRTAATQPETPRRPLGLNRRTVLAMAASFLVALALGVTIREIWHRETPMGGSSTQTASEQTEPDRPTENGPSVPESPEVPQDQWRWVEVSVPTSPGSPQGPIRLPAVASDRLDDAWLYAQPAPVPPDVLQAFRRTGHEVRQSRQLLPFRMKDGQQLVVPVDQVEVQYVGNPSY